MQRGQWIDNCARVLYMLPGTISVIASRAKQARVVTVGARGLNSKPFTMAEQKTILERVVAARCIGRLEPALGEMPALIRWDDDGLWATRPDGLSVTAHIRQRLLERILCE